MGFVVRISPILVTLENASCREARDEVSTLINRSKIRLVCKIHKIDNFRLRQFISKISDQNQIDCFDLGIFF